MGEIINVTRADDGVVLIRIDNPPTNALGAAPRARLHAVLDEIELDLSVRCVVLTGTGDAFCSGDDLKAMSGGGVEAMENLEQFARLFTRIETLRAPVIAAVNGYAAGGGLEIALASDIRLAARGARFIAAAVNVGLMASAWRLPRLIGLGRARAILLTGAPLDAQTALDWGLVTGLHDADELAPQALQLATRIATRAPLSVEATKRMSGASVDLDPIRAAQLNSDILSGLALSADHQEALNAFRERRSPVFTRS